MMAAFYTLTELWPERAAAQMNERERLVLRILLRKAGDLSAEIESLRSGWRRRTEAEALREKEQGRGT